MKRKSLWKIAVATTPEAEEAVAELLGSRFGCAPVTSFNPAKGESRVAVFLPQKVSRHTLREIREGLRRIGRCGLQTGAARICLSRLRPKNWAESWKRHFKPLEIGRTLLVKPGWSKRRPRNNQAVVVLDPGLSFGTGHHPTTAFCLQQIVAACGKSPPVSQAMPRRSALAKSFLDLGTGSGILAIAAAKLGFAPVQALDIDPLAVKIARQNARRNGVAGKIRFRRGDVADLPLCPPRRYDLVCANLLSPLLVAQRKRIAAQLNPGGTLVLAGILKTEFPAVEQCFARLGLKCVSVRTEKEWRSGAFQSA
jgi:ribosomal protein L11 methyltransferase